MRTEVEINCKIIKLSNLNLNAIKDIMEIADQGRNFKINQSF